MSHRHTVIEPSAGLTVLVGPNNCGKSAIVTALQIICHNDNSTYVLRHGAKECRIIVETEEGHRIEWIRKKSGSPKYLINGKEFDRLRNESGVWNELKRTLRMPRLEFDNNKFDVHIGEQRNPVFLLGDKGRGAAQFFASSSDAIRLVEMQALHKKQVSENKSDRKWLAKEQTETKETLELLEDVPKLANDLTECERQYDSLCAEQHAAKDLELVLGELRQTERNRDRFRATEAALRGLSPLPHFEDPASLEGMVEQIQHQRIQISAAKNKLEVLDQLIEPPTFENESKLAQSLSDLEANRTAVERLSRINNALSKIPEPLQTQDAEAITSFAKFLLIYQTELETCAELKNKLDKATKDLKRAESEIEGWISENPNCPTCGNEITADALIGEGGHQHG